MVYKTIFQDVDIIRVKCLLCVAHLLNMVPVSYFFGQPDFKLSSKELNFRSLERFSSDGVSTMSR